MTDTTDIKALREGLVELLDHVDSYGGKCWLFPEDVRSIISSLDQLEAERQRADDAGLCYDRLRQRWVDEIANNCDAGKRIKDLEAELAALKGEQVPLQQLFKEAIAWGRVYGPTMAKDLWFEMLETQSCNFAGRFTAPQKPVGLPDKIPDAFYKVLYDECGGFVDCDIDTAKVWRAAKAAIEAAGGIVKEEK